LVWITGNSGIGKSTICELLRRCGYVSLDADDDGYSRWVDRTTGEVAVDPPYPVPAGWLDRFGWAIVRERVEELAAQSRSRVAFLCGSVENEADVRELFDLTVCLVVDDETLRHRLRTRTTNAFGKNPEELAAVLGWNPGMRSTYDRLGAAIVDASQPPAEVADRILEAARQISSSPISAVRPLGKS
jgi:adenylate kinase family enzyme